ncbi:AAA family ATPase [Peptoniphilus sp. oral taxon 386]|uniref:AAA family ATPase n=1 Tax=Peptoniphilus sp. oral taxon 386 TaxID=652713 RepID=UPI0001DA9D3C|nr:AAA family ATPase [Peptoniphilus sp. oral taxon 386]EFI42288.1 RecF/RecN/SMC N-terminal domain protein [Peptoniphilus sp. oral taxon 386 str. F0131]
MIFITKVELINFQSHENTVIDFHRGLNVILGNSDSGKTAILRAIKWALYNEPSGNYFIREGEKETSVTIYFNTGAVVKRYRSNSKNTYYLKKSNLEEFNFDGFGLTVPKEIITEIGMSKINLDNSLNSIINIAEQLDGPFLLNEKTSVRASAIGRIIGVNYIDDALRETIRDNKQIASDIKYLKSKKEIIEAEILKFDYLKETEVLLNTLIEIKEIITYSKTRLNKLIELKNKYEFNNNELEKLRKENSKYKNLDLLYNLLSNIEIILFKYNTYSNFYKNLNFYNYEINENIKCLNKYKNLSELSLKYDTLNSLLHDYFNNISIKNEFLDISNRIDEGVKFIDNLKYIDKLETIYKNLVPKIDFIFLFERLSISNKKVSYDINKLEEHLNALSNDIKEKYFEYEKNILNLGYCPFCYSEIDENIINHIRKHYKE